MNSLNVLKSFRDCHISLSRTFISPLAFRCFSNYDKNEGESKNDAKKENEKINKNKTSEVAIKLNKLLLQMADNTTAGKTKLNLAKPSPKKKEPKAVLEEPPVNFEKRLETAAKEVAHSLGSDEKRVESELLSKLLNISSKADTDTAVTLSSIVKGMKIERDTKSSEQLSRAQQVKQLLGRTKRGDVNMKSVPSRSEKRVQFRAPLKSNIQRADIFSADPLGLFNNNLKNEGVTNSNWQMLHEKELQLAVTHPPANYFQQMIQWTEAGKIWQFPIDNEQGMEKEKNVYFAEHVFLEKHLETWCPSKGPVRHFMELVCVGLSKNPYMSVETKKEHIAWYKKYFEDKMQLLEEIGAVPTQSTRTAAITEK